jgi:ABC-2 type transport system permease protein
MISLTIYSSISQGNEYIEYFIFGNFIYKLYLLFGDIAWEVRSDIFYGGLSNKLLLPSNYSLFQVFSCMGGNLFTVQINLMILILILISNNIFFRLNIAVFPFIIMGAIIYFSIDLIVGSLTFWIKSTNTLIEMKSSIVPFVAGGLVLLSTNKITQTFIYTPFAYMIHHPMQIYLGNYNANQTLLVFAGGIAWCIILYFLAKLVFKMGLKRNEAVGL